MRIAIGSGGWSGQGLFQGPQTQGGFIPFQQTDFVFSVAGEELGFLGAAGCCCSWASSSAGRPSRPGAQDTFGRLVGARDRGVAAFQVFENVGMNLGLTPVTGLPLPFLSYGGSSMFACWLAVGLVSNVPPTPCRRRRRATATRPTGHRPGHRPGHLPGHFRPGDRGRRWVTSLWPHSQHGAWRYPGIPWT